MITPFTETVSARRWLRAGFDVVGEAADGRQAVALSLELQPDVVIMDLDMPGMGGIEATRRIAHGSPHVGIWCSPCSPTMTRCLQHCE